MIGHGRAGHLDVVTAEEEEHCVTAQTQEVEEDDELDGSLGTELEALQNVAAKEDADARTRDGDPTREHAGHALAQVELCLQVLGQEHDESGHDDELHAGPQARDHIDLVSEEFPRGTWNVLDVLAIAVHVCVGGLSGEGIFVLGTDAGIRRMVVLLVDVHLHLLFL